MKSYLVSFTSTETLFDEEKQRKQSTITIKAKQESEVKQKTIDQLTATGRHNQIVIHSIQLEKRQSGKNRSWILIVLLAVCLVIIFQSFIK